MFTSESKIWLKIFHDISDKIKLRNECKFITVLKIIKNKFKRLRPLYKDNRTYLFT